MPGLVALLLSAGLTPALARVGPRVGLVDHPSKDGLKIHREPVPLTGGIGIVVAVLVGLWVAGGSFDAWFATAVVLLLLLGVLDDRLTLAPPVRLAAQIAIGIVLAAGGVTFASFTDIGPLLVVIGVPVMANAVNLMDGQDGLAAGSAAVAAIGISVIASSHGTDPAQGVCLIAALGGFLIWNRPPATVFLGDGGAYTVGGALLLIAAGASSDVQGVLGSAICLGLFAFELVSTVVRRVVKRSSPLSGDRAHIYDLLALRLDGRTRATAVLLAVGLVLAASGYGVSRMALATALVTTVAIASIGLVAILTLWRRSAAELRRSG